MKEQINEIIEKRYTNISKVLIQEQLKNFFKKLRVFFKFLLTKVRKKYNIK